MRVAYVLSGKDDVSLREPAVFSLSTLSQPGLQPYGFAGDLVLMTKIAVLEFWVPCFQSVPSTYECRKALRSCAACKHFVLGGG